ncbi:spx domain-containing protein 4 [Phtheirospermum japonicum]|uniref:Spx domain-containing protein 4 n=1 Tax=Phtheirospermum japonicum TaxID=374723 RepID=A0A830BSB1_9LAMI|nr:spx domain-containing protein 4 [Phtheirospermum japonicum]
MKFGKEFRIHLEETLPEWRDKYLSYKPLKKLLKNIPAPGADHLPLDGALPELHEWFVGILNEELEKFNDFYVDKEEDFIIRFQALKERIERLKARGSREGVFTSGTEFSQEMMEIRKDFVDIHGEMVLLKNYSSLNFAGLIKILKKYDKRTGELLSLPFTQLAVHQPFFITEPLTRLVRDCEANLELLFPLEAEVIESTPNDQKHKETTHTNAPNAPQETKPPLGEETADIYKSTLAAIKAIQGLKKASSTYNPLSLSYLFGNQDIDGTGAVTEENSPCDSNGDVCLPK